MDQRNIGVMTDLTGQFTRADRSLATLEIDGAPLEALAIFTCYPDRLEGSNVPPSPSRTSNRRGAPESSVFIIDRVDIDAMAEAILACGHDPTTISFTRSPLSQALAVAICRSDPRFELMLGVWAVTQDEVAYVVGEHTLATRPRPARALLIWEAAGLAIDDGSWLPVVASLQTLPDHDGTIVRAPSPRSQPLAHARIMVDIGAGAALDAHDVELAEHFARRIGASLGCTRVISDRGLLPTTSQIGTTGIGASPDVLIAFGVSGAIQHLGALDIPSHSISVNLDAGAPMQQAVDRPLTADARAVLAILAAEDPTTEVHRS
ncbi:MAG: FAD-binding protein [Acidimicrobiales bacterium]